MDVELLDVGIDWTGQRIAAVQPEHGELRTPCAEWTVRQLLNHLLGVMDTITDALAGQPWPDGVDGNTLADTDPRPLPGNRPTPPNRRFLGHRRQH